jgi:hypothetical protein
VDRTLRRSSSATLLGAIKHGFHFELKFFDEYLALVHL